MKPVGGFFELELNPGGKTHCHPGALALCSGRACLLQILQKTRPSQAWLPFYVCDSVLEPFDRLHIPYSFFAIDESLEPRLPTGLSESACILFVNYFGLKKEAAEGLPGRTRAHVIIDDTQAFFERGHDQAWSFNSARKFFGVPDGGYAYGPELALLVPANRNDDVRFEHLMNRLLGRQELAYQQFVESERHVPCELLGPSLLSERLLRAIDYASAKRSRVENFQRLHERLGPWNQLKLNLDRLGEAVPLCYPFLPESNVRHESLWERSVFVPRLWPEVQQRAGSGFDWERDLASRLLPLPIDHRYGAEEMAVVSESVFQELA